MAVSDLQAAGGSQAARAPCQRPPPPAPWAGRHLAPQGGSAPGTPVTPLVLALRAQDVTATKGNSFEDYFLKR